MKQITSLNNPMIKDAVSLHQKKYRDEFGAFLVEGKGPCADALNNGWECVALFVHEQKEMPDEDNVIHVTQDILEKISKKDNPQHVIGVFKQRVATVPTEADFYLALEEIRDPGNLGTIMRTAHAVNVKNILLIGQCCDPFNPEVIRASMGSFSAVNIIPMTQNEFLSWQQSNQLALLGTDVVNATDYRQTDFSNAVLVMGNEQKGLSPSLKSQCTGRVHIPMPGGTESLNLSIATGLLLYQAALKL
jgi:RNA methyltransferase, TrmH family